MLFLGVLVLGVAIGLAQIRTGPFVALGLAIGLAFLLGLFAGRPALGSFLVGVGLTELLLYLPSLLFDCGGGRAEIDGNGLLVKCLEGPSPFFVVAVVAGAASAIVGLGLLVAAAMRRGISRRDSGPAGGAQ